VRPVNGRPAHDPVVARALDPRPGVIGEAQVKRRWLVWDRSPRQAKDGTPSRPAGSADPARGTSHMGVRNVAQRFGPPPQLRFYVYEI